MDNIKQQIGLYILTKFLPGEKSANLQDDTPLLTSGIVDSMGLFEVIAFIEQKFSIEVDDREAIFENFGRIQDIAAFVESKRAMRK